MDKMHTQKVTGTGAVITVKPGFKPSAIEILNVEGLCSLNYVPDLMDAGYGFKRVTDGTTSFITSGGIEVVNDLSFTIGTDTDVNVSGEDMIVLAYR
jgi:hypothetical protein